MGSATTFQLQGIAGATVISQLPKSSPQSSWESKHFYYWISITPECCGYHRKSTKGLQKQEATLPFFCRQANIINPMCVLMINSNQTSCEQAWLHLGHPEFIPALLGNWGTICVGHLALLVFRCPVMSDSSEMPWTASLSLTISKFAQVHVHCISDAIQPSHPLMPSSPSTLNLY